MALFWLTRQGIMLMHGENWKEANQRVWKYIRLAEEKEQHRNIWRSIRKIEDLTQMKMAERLDINIKRYQRLERMEAEPVSMQFGIIIALSWECRIITAWQRA